MLLLLLLLLLLQLLLLLLTRKQLLPEQALPNVVLWRMLPSLVVDGVAFTRLQLGILR